MTLKIGIVFFVMNLCFNVHAETWYSFTDKSIGADKDIGFKDKEGNVRIEPTFGGLTLVNRFDDIIAVHEVSSNRSESYYLLKSGKKIGHDMMWISDFTFDCENERHIRFKDTNKDLVGMFNHKGDIVIPPIYSSLSKVHNGYVFARLGAEKVNWDKHNNSGCNHYSLVGGKTSLLNIKNEILVENIGDDLDLYSLHIDQKPSTKSYEKSYLGTNGKYFILEIYADSFKAWFIENILNEISIESLTRNVNEEILVRNNKEIVMLKENFLAKKFNILNKNLLILKTNLNQYQLHVGGLDNTALKLFEERNDKYQKYSNNCFRYEKLKYPTFTYFPKMIVGDNKYITFLKTDDGYKLIEINL